MEAIIRKMRETDIEQVSNIAQRSCIEVMSKYHSKTVIDNTIKHLTSESFRKQMDWKEIFVAEIDKNIVGTGALANFGTKDINKYSVSNFFVLPEMQGKGIGKRILEKIIIAAKNKNAIKLHCPSSRNGLKFYDKYGFTIDKAQDELKDEITWMTKEL